MNESNKEFDPDDEIDLFKLIATIWSGKWVIVTFSVIAAGLSAYVALQMPNSYRVEIKIAPVANGEVGQMGGSLTQYRGLASLAGISLPSSGRGETDLLLEILKSREFISRFIEDEALGPRLLALGRYDRTNNKEYMDPRIFDPIAKQWLREVNPPQLAEPSEEELYNKFLDSLIIMKEKASPLIVVSFEHQSPLLGFDILRRIIKRLDDYARKKDKTKSEQSIKYLENKLSETRLVEVERALYQMIESQTKTLMLAEVNADYVFQVIDPPQVPERQVSPKRAHIVILSTLVGGMIGVLIVLISSAVRRWRAETV
ncbi:Wzz/FepE/Etk N-terminal domain-containing protein [Litorivicinus sp.]|nr:Wzz/FepE/Etk N-terminal domain-containing protein [Litorivicinus sp.]